MPEENKNYDKCKKIKLGLIVTSVLVAIIIIWFILRQTGMINDLGNDIDIYGGTSTSSVTSPLSYSLNDTRYSTIFSSTSY